MKGKILVFLIAVHVFTFLLGYYQSVKIFAEASYPKVPEYFNESAINTRDERGYLHFNETSARLNGERVIAYSEEIGENSNKGKYFEVATIKPIFNTATNTYSITVYFYVVKWPGNKPNGGASANYGYCYPDKYLYVDVFDGDVIEYTENNPNVDGDLVASGVMNNHRIDNNSDAGNRIFLQGVYRVDSVTLTGLSAGNYVLRLWDNNEGASNAMNCGGLLGYHELILTPDFPEYAIQYDYQGGSLPSGKVNPKGYSKEDTVNIISPEKNGHTFVGWNEILQTTDWRKGRVTKSTGRATPDSSYKNAIYSDFLRVEAGVTYSLKNIGDSKVDVHFFDMNMNVKESEYFDSSTKTTFTPSETRYVRFCFARGHSSNSPGALQIVSFKQPGVTIPVGSTGNRKYIANWTASKIKLTLNPNGGSGGTKNVWYYYGINKFYSNEACTTQISAIVRPTRTGYDYVHYYGDGTCGGNNGERYIAYDGVEFASDLCTDIYKDATLYAKWNPRNNISYKVNHFLMDIDGNYQLQATESKIGTTDSLVTPTQKDYGVGIQFNAKKSTPLPAVIKEDHSTVINYYYERIKYTITLNKSNGIDNVTGGGTYYYGKNVAINATVKRGYQWQKWISNTNYLPGSTNQLYSFNMPANNVTLLATAEVIPYNITYIPNGGIMPNTYVKVYTVEDEVKLPTIKKEGYVFIGWYDNKGFNGNVIEKIEKGTIGDKQYFAKFVPITYIVEYHGNGNTSGSMEPSVHVYDQLKELNRSTYKKVNSSFVGWNTEADGSGIWYKDGQEVVNLTNQQGDIIRLYAQYNSSNYVVNFDSNGGLPPSFTTIEQAFGEPLKKLPTTSFNGYEFDGWYSSKTGGTKISVDTVPTENTTYYAHWKVIPPNVVANKKYYYQNTTVTVDMLIQNATANDCVDGNISNQIIVSKVVYPNGTVVHYPTVIDTTNVGDISVEYKVTNKRGASAVTVNTVTIIAKGNQSDDLSKTSSVYSRFIADLALDDGKNAKETLNSKSIWNLEEYKTKLEKALSNTRPLEEYEYINR